MGKEKSKTDRGAEKTKGGGTKSKDRKAHLIMRKDAYQGCPIGKGTQ